MTQKCQHDEQLLDYVYGELSDAERKIFAEHLVTCSTCPAQVESFGGIRKEFQQRTPIEPAGEAMQRMTALLMQAAAAQHGPAAGADADGGGKILAFRSRGLRRILFHPAGGVMAVAAAALFWVVFRAQPVPPTGLSAPTSATAFIPEPAREGAPAPVAAAPETATATPDPVAKEKSAPAKEAESAPRLAGDDAKLQAVGRSGIIADKGFPGDVLKDSNFDGLRARSRDSAATGLLAKNEQKPQLGSQPMVAAKPLPPAVPSKPAMVARLETTSPATGAAAGKADSAGAPGAVAQYRSSGPAVVAMADQAYGKAAKKSAGYEAERPAEHWSTPPAAEPPPPPAAATRSLNDEETASVRENIARTQERRKQKVVDELANQELGTLAAGAPAASAPATDNRYAQRGPVNSSPTDTGSNNYGSPSAPSAVDDTPTPVATPTMPAANQIGRGAVIGGAADDGSSALSTAKEQLRRGQCTEANATLAKLERTLPLLHGLSETRADWQASCATPSQQLLDRRMNLDSAEQAAPAPARAMKSRLASPMPAKAPANKPSKAPSKARAADAL